MGRSRYWGHLVVAVACAGMSGGCNGDEPAVRAIRATGAPVGELVLDLSQQTDGLVAQRNGPFYDFDQAGSEFLREGWGRPEISADGTRTFAWATSRRASVRLNLRDPVGSWLHFRTRAAAAAEGGAGCERHTQWPSNRQYDAPARRLPRLFVCHPRQRSDFRRQLRLVQLYVR